MSFDWILELAAFVAVVALGIPLLILLVLTPLIIVGALGKTQQTCCFGPQESLGEGKFAMGPYLAAMMQAASVQGFGAPSVHRHFRYDLTCAGWFDEKRITLLISGQGKALGLPARQTRLFTRLSDGRILLTTDELDEGDSSGQSEIKRVVNADLAELLRAHDQRLDQSQSPPAPFTETTPIEALDAIMRQRAGSLIRRGRARWIDEKKGTWRYNVRGAFRTWLTFLKQMASAITQVWRAQRRRPGE